MCFVILFLVISVPTVFIPVFIYLIAERLQTLLAENVAIRKMIADEIYMQAKLLDSYGIDISSASSPELVQAVVRAMEEQEYPNELKAQEPVSTE